MKSAWIAGRFLIVGLVIGATMLSMGSAHPLAMFGLNQLEDSNASKATRAYDDQLGEQTSAAGKKEKFDLAATLEAKGWKDPKFVLFVTGRQHGYIEPCGCITLDRQKGGLMRRDSVRLNLVAKGWDVIPIDAGNQIRRLGNQPEMKIHHTYQALCKEMDYDMVGIGPDDVKMAGFKLGMNMENAKRPLMVNGEATSKNPFTCANIEIINPGWIKPFTTVQKNDKRVGITMVLGNEHLEGVSKEDVKAVSPERALNVIAPKMAEAKSDMNVLVAFTSLDNCRDLAKKYPIYDVLVTAGGAGDPTLEPEIIDDGGGSKTSMIQVGVKGMYVGLIGYFVDAAGQPSIKYERVELDARFEDSPAIKTVFKSYQDDLKRRWEMKLLDDIRPRPHASGNTFVGSLVCSDCHGDEYEIWEDGNDGNGGPHSEATASLKHNPNDDRVWLERQFDPECVSCHSTGWNPQNFYPYESGYMDFKKDELLHGNGCENCHGPGSAHVAIQKEADKGVKVDEIKRAKLQDEMKLTIAEARKDACRECHDLDNSPDFLKGGGFDKYWPKIEH